MAGKRNAAYYKARLRRDYPAVFAGLSSGKYVSVRKAAAAAGLIRLPTRVDALKREWKKANNAQQVEFVKWQKANVPKRVAKPIADPDGRLRPDVSAFLKRWIKSYGSKPGRILKVIGFSNFDPTFAMAIYSGHELRPAVIPKLSEWLTKQGFR